MLKSLTLSLLFCSLWAEAPYEYIFYQDRLQEIEQMQQSDLIFLGDSLTQRNNWSAFKASNMGIDGDTTDGIIARLHHTKKAKRIVVMIGVNDILTQTPLSKIKINYSNILNSFSREQDIYVISLLPVIDARQTKGINQDIKTMNKWLESQVKEHGFNYLNFYPKFLDTNKKGIKETFTTDGIHLTPHAYKLWEKLLKEALQ